MSRLKLKQSLDQISEKLITRKLKMIKIGGKGYLETKENWKIQKDFPNTKLKLRKRKEGYGVQKID